MIEWFSLLMPTFSKILDKLFTNKDDRAKAQEELEAAFNAGELQLALKQIEVNLAEAQTGNMFIAGGRPLMMWIGAISVGYAYLLYPFIVLALNLAGVDPTYIPMPAMEWLMPIVMTLIGARSWEKVKGVSTDRVNFKPKVNIPKP